MIRDFYLYKEPGWEVATVLNLEWSANVYTYGPIMGDNNPSNLVKPFPWTLWMLVLLTTAAAIALFLSFFKVYSLLPQRHTMLTARSTNADIILKTIGSLTEPDQVPVFLGWNTGLCKHKSVKNGVSCKKNTKLSS